MMLECIVDIILEVSNQDCIQSRISKCINWISTSTHTSAVQLINDYTEYCMWTSRFVDSISEGRFSTSCYGVTINEPLVSQITLVVVTQMSGSSNFLIDTNSIIIKSNHHIRLIFNIQIERSTYYFAVSTLIQHHCNFIWIISSGQTCNEFWSSHWGRINTINSP